MAERHEIRRHGYCVVARLPGGRTNIGVEIGIVQILDNRFDGRDGPVPNLRIGVIMVSVWVDFHTRGERSH